MRMVLSALVLALSIARSTQAEDLRAVLTDYDVTAWSEKDGLPRGAIRALAQDADGYLWIGSEYGLVRFDGLRFLTWEALGNPPLPGQTVSALRAARDGSLWVGFGNRSPIVRIKGAEVTVFTAKEGLPPGEVPTLVEDPNGVIWAAHSNGVFHFANQRWERDTSVPPGRVRKLHSSSSGRLFAMLDQSVVVRQPGGHVFEHISTPERFITAVHEDPSGNVWMSDNFVGVMRKGSTEVKRLRVRPSGSGEGMAGVGTSLLSDKTGGLWIGTSGQGLWYARRPSTTGDLEVETVTTLTGMSNDIVNVLLEDREGNIWAGSGDGLNRLRRYPFKTMTDLEGITGLDSSPDGTIWAMTSAGLRRFASGTGRQTTVPLPSQVRAMHADRTGAAWLATDDGVWRYAGGASVTGTRISDKLRRVRAITSDPKGHVWFYDLDLGVGVWDGHALEVITLPSRYQHALICSIQADRHGRVWIGFRQELVPAISPGPTFTAYTPAEGIDSGTCNELYEDRSGSVWVLGIHGLGRFANGRFNTLRGPRDVPLESLHGMVQDDAGAVWLNSQSSIARIPAEDIEHAFAGQWDRVRPSVFGADSGIAGRSARVGSSATRTAGGQLWFLTSRGVTIIDPATLSDSLSAPPVHIDTVIVDDRRGSPHTTMLPPRVRRVEVEYSLPTLSPGPRPRFRYRLDGFDTEWHDAGANQRRVAYTNLPPRDYQLRVEDIAADGMVRSSAVWNFAVQPAFYQTTWFVVLALVGAGGVASVAWRRRLHQVRGEFALLLKERVRLSREIHDTLLQSLIGVSLQLEQVEHDVDASADGKQQLRKARRQVEEYIREARESIWNLRSSALEREGLAAALRHSGERAVEEARNGHRTIQWQFTVVGTPDRCANDVEEQLLRIGQEAMTNATRHGEAQMVSMELRYDESTISLKVIDDGCGFDPARLAGVNGDHWGLVSMRERATTVGGTFSLTSTVGHGTEVEAIVPRNAITQA